MDDDILKIGLINLVFGILALTTGYLYTLPRDHIPMNLSAPMAMALGGQ
jgi:hypothetical protein